MVTKTQPCKGAGGCGGTFSAEVSSESPAKWTTEDWGAMMDARSEHIASHGRNPDASTHIRKKITRTRTTRSVTSTPGYGAAIAASSEHNGSQALCGEDPTDSDVSWADGRFPKYRQHVTCQRCLELRTTS